MRALHVLIGVGAVIYAVAGVKIAEHAHAVNANAVVCEVLAVGWVIAFFWTGRRR